MATNPSEQSRERQRAKADVSHYGVIMFSGDPAEEHPNAELCGSSPSMTLIACGSRDFCWRQLARWTESHALRMWEDAEVLARDMTVVGHAKPLPRSQPQNES